MNLTQDLEFTQERILAIRKRLALTQVEFARKLLVHQSTVAGWETGAREPANARIVARLLDAEREAAA